MLPNYTMKKKKIRNQLKKIIKIRYIKTLHTLKLDILKRRMIQNICILEKIKIKICIFFNAKKYFGNKAKSSSELFLIISHN